MAQDRALRKRQQIANANRTMFITVAGVSALVGMAIVVSIFLGQKLLFNEKVLGEKQHTINVLQDNNKVASRLKDNIRVLNTSQELTDAKAHPEDAPLRVVLDALPADANSSAFGASLQQVLLVGEGISIDTLSLNPVSGVESSVSDPVTTDTATTSADSIVFSFSVSTTPDGADSLRQLLQRLERSVRIVRVLSYEIERQGSRLALKATAEVYYQPETVATLKDKVVRP
ncbi:MAG: hypothetical protein JWM00_46 [Candidatus Saccharibacteria bacterium]|nr:hypothetical protein [Candidatus Saccharibacteria bacterium]